MFVLYLLSNDLHLCFFVSDIIFANVHYVDEH